MLGIGDEIQIQSLSEPPQLIATLAAPGAQSLTLSPDGTLLAAVVQEAIFSPDGANVILSASLRGDEEIERFDVATGDPLSEFGLVHAYASYIGSFSFSPDGSRLAEVDIAYTLRSAPFRLRIWDGFGGLYEDYNQNVGFGGGWVRYSPDGQALAVALDGNPIPTMRAFGVVLDPCANGTCSPNRLPAR